jgi:phosphate transport system substrate-binding protein
MRLVLVALLVAALGSAADQITGAGATFPAPLYEKWLEAFQSGHPGMPVSYDAVGSGEGLKRLQAGVVDFAASDIPVSDPDLLSIPTVVGGVVPVFNLPGVTADLRLTSDIVAGIFLGKIRRWNDPAIRAVNRNVALPDADIVVVHRGDSSGTTYIWSSWLSKNNVAWRTAVGVGGSVNWPVGVGETGNNGVATKVQETPDSIGYTEFIYALRDRLSYAEVRNAAGHFIQPDTESIRAAAVDPSGEHAFPITAVTWIVLPKQIAGAKRARLVDFLNWVLDRGQNQAASLGFIPLSAGQLAKAHESLATLP